jgi:hypothetical protein
MKLFEGDDGKFSYTKFFAIVFHTQLAGSVGWYTYRDQEFNTEMWWFYGAMAAGHVTLNKAISAIQQFQNKKIDASSAPVVETTTTTTARGSPP